MMKQVFWLLISLCALSACGKHEQTSAIASDAKNTLSASAASALPTTSAASAFPTTSAPASEQSTLMPIVIDPALVTSVDQQIQTLQKKLPYKQNGNELTSIIRHNQYVYYHYRVLDSHFNSQNFDRVHAKEQLLENCRHNKTRRILTGGFSFVYVYTFTDHTQASIRLIGTDCH